MPICANEARSRMNFIERTLSSLVNAMERALYAEELAKADGLLQRLDPRIKVIGILALVMASAMAHKLWVIGALFAVAVSGGTDVSRLFWKPGQAGVACHPFCYRGHCAARAIYYPRPRDAGAFR